MIDIEQLDAQVNVNGEAAAPARGDSQTPPAAPSQSDRLALEALRPLVRQLLREELDNEMRIRGLS